MMCEFCIGRRFLIDNLRIVDWLDNFRNTDFHRIVFNLKTSTYSTNHMPAGSLATSVMLNKIIIWAIHINVTPII